jgi:predicted polyphosphate/ATP-dependent NAD kinase
MKPVGIIANPASGKDIRRMIASGTTVTNQEKQNIIIRIVRAMDALGVGRVEIMPDNTRMGLRVMRELEGELENVDLALLDFPYVLGTQKDSIRAAQLMAEKDFSCIIVLGGDGTSRVVSKTCGEVPLIPVSTGTNNVFPQMIEGTLVGMAAAAIANGTVTQAQGCDRAPRLDLHNDAGFVVDHALVDLVVVDARDIASRAVWEPETIREVYLTQARPTNIGLSSIGGQIHPLEPMSGEALKIVLNSEASNAFQVTAPIAPGLMKTVSIESYKTFDSSTPQRIAFTPGAVALDGEREVIIPANANYTVNLNKHGPLVVNIERTLGLASNLNFLSGQAEPAVQCSR